jgi:hypothetical protein
MENSYRVDVFFFLTPLPPRRRQRRDLAPRNVMWPPGPRHCVLKIYRYRRNLDRQTVVPLLAHLFNQLFSNNMV